MTEAEDLNLQILDLLRRHEKYDRDVRGLVEQPITNMSYAAQKLCYFTHGRKDRDDEAMSELTQCNCCSLATMRATAKMDGTQIITISSYRPLAGMAGVGVFKLPAQMKRAELTALSDDEKRDYEIAWFGALTDRCCC